MSKYLETHRGVEIHARRQPLDPRRPDDGQQVFVLANNNRGIVPGDRWTIVIRSDGIQVSTKPLNPCRGSAPEHWNDFETAVREARRMIRAAIDDALAQREQDALELRARINARAAFDAAVDAFFAAEKNA